MQDTIEDTLRLAGFGHRPSRFPNKREVFRLTGGAAVGDMDALEAAAFAEDALAKARPPEVCGCPFNACVCEPD